MTTANISALGAPYFISVKLKTSLPYTIGLKTILPFHSCSWCSMPEGAPYFISVKLKTSLPYAIGLPLWIVIGISRFFNKILTQRPLLRRKLSVQDSDAEATLKGEVKCSISCNFNLSISNFSCLDSFLCWNLLSLKRQKSGQKLVEN